MTFSRVERVLNFKFWDTITLCTQFITKWQNDRMWKEKYLLLFKRYLLEKKIYWVQATPSSEPVIGYTVMNQKETRFFPHVIHSLKEETKINR